VRVVRYSWRGVVGYGILDGVTVRPLASPPLPLREDGQLPPVTGEALPLDEVRFLAPVSPGKVVCVGLNYRTHALELGMPLPEEPVLFLKPPSAVIGPGDPIVLPAASHRVDYEGELVAVIGRRLRHAGPEEALAGILGYTCGNDVTARDLQQKDGQWTRAKGFDTFAPLGPAIAVGLDPDNLHLVTLVNGAPRQRDTTANLIFRVGELVSFISGVMTLEPGDVVFTGTPAGIGPLADGDVVEVDIEGIGRLRNPVRAAQREA